MLLLTGSPGVGKTSVLLRMVDSLREEGHIVGGMVSREARVDAVRVGFEILDLSSGRKGWLAHIAHGQGPKVGRYTVNIQDLEDIGVGAIMDAIDKSDVVVVDEIGPMELHSSKFRQAIRKALQSSKLVVCVVHRNDVGDFLTEIAPNSETKIHTVTLENRKNLHMQLAKEATHFLVPNK